MARPCRPWSKRPGDRLADSSAIVKLYVDEEGHEAVRALSGLAVGQW